MSSNGEGLSSYILPNQDLVRIKCGENERVNNECITNENG